MAVRIWTGKDTEADKGDEFYDVTWAGRVLRLVEHNYHDDSDFFAEVWDEEKGEPREVWYATTRGWTYNNGASVDADEATLAAYAAYRDKRYRRAAEERRAYEESRLARGRRVRVVKGRKVPVGTEGTLIWLGGGRFGGRVGLKDDEGTVHFTAAGNVAVMQEDRNEVRA